MAALSVKPAFVLVDRRHQRFGGTMARLAISMKMPAKDIQLQKGEVWRAEGDLRGEVFQCQKGMLWITQQGDLNDYILNPGERFWVTRPGTVLVESVKGARFSCSRCNPPEHEPVYAHLGAD